MLVFYLLRVNDSFTPAASRSAAKSIGALSSFTTPQKAIGEMDQICPITAPNDPANCQDDARRGETPD